VNIRKRYSWRELESASCPVCLSDTVVPGLRFERGDGLAVATCSDCLSRYVTPRPSKADLASFYQSEAAIQMGSGYRQRMEVVIESGYKSLSTLPPPTPGRNRMIDVGAAGGFAMLCAQRSGWDVIGIEYSESLASLGRSRYGLRIITGTQDNLAAIPGEFDVITALDVVEHLGNIPDLLKLCALRLVRGGLLLIDTPNFPSHVSPDLIARSNLGESFKLHLEHLSYLSLESFQYLAEKSAKGAGLVISDWGSYGLPWRDRPKDVWLGRSLRESLEKLPGFSRLYWQVRRRALSETPSMLVRDDSGIHLWVHLRKLC
jgi:2-polyprenyl-3-methyl-5-hydroxy-6-metoxy-1,4-benzoquinol methylase